MQISKEEKFDLTGLTRREMANILDALTFYWADNNSAKRDERSAEIAEMRDEIGMTLGVKTGNRPVDQRFQQKNDDRPMRLFFAEVTGKAIRDGEEYHGVVIRADSTAHAASILNQLNSLARNYSIKELTHGGAPGVILQGD